MTLDNEHDEAEPTPTDPPRHVVRRRRVPMLEDVYSVIGEYVFLKDEEGVLS